VRNTTSVYGPSAAVRTARFFLPSSERRTNANRDAGACLEHMDDLRACRSAGCPNALKSPDA